jgi:hypothetical protein
MGHEENLTEITIRMKRQNSFVVMKKMKRNKVPFSIFSTIPQFRSHGKFCNSEEECTDLFSLPFGEGKDILQRFVQAQ